MATRRPPVLIVDDDDDIRDVLRLLLEDDGYPVVHEATDGREALDRMRAQPEGSKGMVVLLDLLMPGVSGGEVLETLAADRALASRYALIVVTATRDTLPLAVASGAAQLNAPIISKPFDMDHVLAVVTQAAQRLGAV